MLAVAGSALYLIEPRYGAAFVAGLLVLGSWIYAYVRQQMPHPYDPGDGPFIVPVCNVVAYALGPIAFTQPLWVPVTIVVAATLFLGERHRLHDWAQRLSSEEVRTAALFLILVGIVLPLLAGRPPIPYTSITPFGVGLAVVAVSTISYASYLLQTYVFPGRGTIFMAILGGLYSSTATTVVLARRARDEGMTPELESGIVAASAMMYVRILCVCALFSLPLAGLLVVPMLASSAACLIASRLRGRAANHSPARAGEKGENPLQLTTALVFALLFVAISAITAAVQHWLGSAGILGLAAIVGVTDIDPFVLSLAQGGAANVPLTTAAVAIVIATASNNALKAVYTIAFSRQASSWIPAALLIAVAGIGLGFAAFMPR